MTWQQAATLHQHIRTFEKINRKPVETIHTPPPQNPLSRQPDSVQALVAYCRELEERCRAWEERYQSLVTVPPPRKYVSFDLIMKAVCHGFHVSMNDVMSNRRLGFISVARQTICYLGKLHTAMSMPWIGRRLDLDHTTVLYAWRRIGTRRLKEPDLDARISRIEQQFAAQVQP